jgi:hypothetical protein
MKRRFVEYQETAVNLKLFLVPKFQIFTLTLPSLSKKP